MGYRSHVVLIVRGLRDDIETQIAKLRLVGDSVMLAATDEWSLQPDKEEGFAIYTLQGDGWKWYESYPDVQAHEAIWRAFSNLAEEQGNDSRISGARARIGEDDDDLSSDYINDGYDLLTLERSITSNVVMDKNLDLRSAPSSGTNPTTS